MSRRRSEGHIQDGQVLPPREGFCPRGRTDCLALARRASEGYESFFCCGETSGTVVPTDTIRFCAKSAHPTHTVDVLLNLDRRDAIDAIAVLAGGLAWDELGRLQGTG